MWFAYSMFSIFAWAGSDLFSKLGTNRNKQSNHLRLVICVGAVMGLHAIGYLIYTGMDYNPVNIIKYFPVSFLYILSMVLGYVGLRYIILSVSSPVCNSSGAVAALLFFLVLGETMTALQLAGVCLISAGILLLSFLETRSARLLPAEKDKKIKSGFVALLFPIMYCIIDGLGTFADGYFLDVYLTEAEANVSYEFTFLICAAACLIYLLFIKKEGFHPKKEGWFTLGALCETAGQFTYIYAISENPVVAAPMIASYSIFSVIFSHIFLREKLEKLQYPVIIMVLAGIAILGIE